MMSAVEQVEVDFNVSTPVSEVRKRIVDALAAAGGKIKVNDSSMVLAGFGSGLKARLLGTMLAGIKAMPRDVQVKFSESGRHTRVDVTVRDTFGFGTRIGIADKLQKQMYEDALSIKRLFG